MNYKLHYSSSRAEIWRWYWRSWKKSLWRIHVILAATVGFVLSGLSFNAMQPGSWIVCTLAVFPVVIAAFAAFPQIMFKPQERTLEVGPEGWASQIGKMSGSRKWSEVASIEDAAGAVVVKGRNGNALVIPQRAFESSAQREQFVRDARLWLSTKG